MVAATRVVRGSEQDCLSTKRRVDPVRCVVVVAVEDLSFSLFVFLFVFCMLAWTVE